MAGDEYHQVKGVPNFVEEIGKMTRQDRMAMHTWTLIADSSELSREELEDAVRVLYLDQACIRMASIRDVLSLKGASFRLAYVYTTYTMEQIEGFLHAFKDHAKIRLVPDGGRLID